MDTRLLWEQVQSDKHILLRDRLVTKLATMTGMLAQLR
jgi:hypothetical protein